jgi:hypothetical protein
VRLGRVGLAAQVDVGVSSVRYEPEGGRGGVRLDHRLDDGLGIADVLDAVGVVDGGVDGVVGFFEDDIAFDPASPDTALAPLQRMAEPSAGVSSPGPYVQVISSSDNPDGRVLGGSCRRCGTK